MSLIIDSSVFINYGLYNKLYRIANAVAEYNLNVYANEALLAEVERNLGKANIRSKLEIFQSIIFIQSFVTMVEVENTFTNSPDPKDNFLFDLALQTNSEVIVTKEKALLNFKDSPVAIHDIQWFKETYPVEL